MSDKPQIPPMIWARIVAFLREQRTGQLKLNIHHGTVSDLTIEERIRESQPEILEKRLT